MKSSFNKKKISTSKNWYNLSEKKTHPVSPRPLFLSFEQTRNQMLCLMLHGHSSHRVLRQREWHKGIHATLKRTEKFQTEVIRVWPWKQNRIFLILSFFSRNNKRDRKIGFWKNYEVYILLYKGFGINLTGIQQKRRTKSNKRFKLQRNHSEDAGEESKLEESKGLRKQTYEVFIK